jgi:hypothetical protein
VSGVLNGISKKSFFKGFLTRGGSKESTVNKSLNMTNAGINMMKKPVNSKLDVPYSTSNRSYQSVNRAFGKDITHKVLNSSGAAVI